MLSRNSQVIQNRIDRDEAIRLLKFAPLEEIQRRSMDVRFRLHPEKLVTFVIDSNPNYTNICEAYCTFCAFYRTKKAKDAYFKSVDEVMQHLEYARKMGVTTVLLQGGVHEEVTIDYLIAIVKESRRRYPDIHPHYFSAIEITNAARVSKISIEEALQKLWDAGLRTIPGGGAEILSERVRMKVSPKKMEENGWLNFHEKAHLAGFKTTATMMYGHVETDEEIIDHLLQLREVQDRTNGFTSFIPWSYKRQNTALKSRVDGWAGGDKYLRVVGVSRIVLDNFPHIGSSWFSEGKQIGIRSLQFGADDFGGTILEENVHKATGHVNTTHLAGITRMIQDAGFWPAQRNSFYEIIRNFDDNDLQALQSISQDDVEIMESPS